MLPGAPRGKAVIQGGLTASRFTDKKTKAEMDALRMIARLAMNGRAPFTGPVELRLCAYVGVPKSWTQKKREAALAGRILPTTKPDGSNVQKLCEDAIQPPPPPKRKKGESDVSYQVRRRVWETIYVVIQDDKQIVRWTGWKVYAANPRVVIEIREIDGVEGA